MQTEYVVAYVDAANHLFATTSLLIRSSRRSLDINEWSTLSLNQQTIAKLVFCERCLTMQTDVDVLNFGMRSATPILLGLELQT